MSHCRLATGVVIAVLGFFCLLVSPSLLKAQTSTSGALRGTLTDPSGRALMGAQVKITNEGTGEVRTTSTQGD